MNMSLRIGTNGMNFEKLSSILGSTETTEASTTTELKKVSEALNNASSLKNETQNAQAFIGRLGFDATTIVRKNLQQGLAKRAAIMGTGVDIPEPQLPPFASKSPLYVKGDGDIDSIAMNDIGQGMIGDCFLLAPLASMAQQGAGTIRDIIHDNGDGTYTVTFKEKQSTDPVTFVDKKITVTADFPGGLAGTGHADRGDKNAFKKGEIWPLIIEKAYAEFKGGYDKINGGNPGDFMEAVTGRPATAYAASKLPSFDELKMKFNMGRPMTVSTKDDGDLGYGLFNDHAYAVKRLYTDETGRQMVELYNPWGTNHPAAIPYDEFSGRFTRVTVG
jgi:hypothetical protein